MWILNQQKNIIFIVQKPKNLGFLTQIIEKFCNIISKISHFDPQWKKKIIKGLL